MVKPDLDLLTGTDPIFRVVNRFCILCLIGSRVGSGNGRVGLGFSFCSPLKISGTLTIRNGILNQPKQSNTNINRLHNHDKFRRQKPLRSRVR
ncbi:hypothetical protein Hanom_Chr01g00081241 [Helianthus anomalus]